MHRYFPSNQLGTKRSLSLDNNSKTTSRKRLSVSKCKKVDNHVENQSVNKVHVVAKKNFLDSLNKSSHVVNHLVSTDYHSGSPHNDSSEEEDLAPTQEAGELNETIDRNSIIMEKNNGSKNCSHEDCCIICGITLVSMSLLEKQVHHNKCLDNFEQPQTVGGKIECPACTKDLSGFNVQRRSAHVNKCLDSVKIIQDNLIKLNEKKLQETNTTIEEKEKSIHNNGYKCPVCSHCLDNSSLSVRLRHVKQCGKRHGIAPSDLGPDASHQECTEGYRNTSEENIPVPSSNMNAFDIMMQPGSRMESIPLVHRRIHHSKSKLFHPQQKGFRRNCPLYKKIKGTSPPIIVDGFQYSSPQLSNVYILTHFHADHYVGLNKGFDIGIIYCTEETANLVVLRIGVNRKYLRVVPLNHPIDINGTEVVFMDANHCPGAAIILFKVKSGKSYLHTGDFRFKREMLDNCFLRKFVSQDNQRIELQGVYLDTTYCNPKYTFPPQKFIINEVIKLMEKHLKKPKILYLFGTYHLGKENLFMEVARKFDLKVYAEKSKYDTLSCLKWTNKEMKYITREAGSTDFRIVPMQRLNFNQLKPLLSENSHRYHQIIAFQPTGWTFAPKSSSLYSCRKSKPKEDIIIYGIPYSEHSSFKELCSFITKLKPKEIIPTVNCNQADSQINLLKQSCYHCIADQLIGE